MEKLTDLLFDVSSELENARDRYPDFHSLHEAYAVIAEELDELWDVVREKGSEKPRFRGRQECIQIAAMALRTILDRDLKDDGRATKDSD